MQSSLLFVSVYKLFEQFLKEESIDGYSCETCKKVRKVKKKLYLWRLPPVLVVHLKRFHFTQSRRNKITTNIQFPDKNLDLGPIIKRSQEQSDSKKFE
jgi:ubiquitin carboxyl-terminal hydrolase 4/11/15